MSLNPSHCFRHRRREHSVRERRADSLHTHRRRRLAPKSSRSRRDRGLQGRNSQRATVVRTPRVATQSALHTPDTPAQQTADFSASAGYAHVAHRPEPAYVRRAGRTRRLRLKKLMSLRVNQRRETVPQSVPVSVLIPAKYWSEWQDLNLRPPRPERGFPLAGARAVQSARSPGGTEIGGPARFGTLTTSPF